MKILYEGKAKIVYDIDDKDYYIQEFKDSLTAFDGTKKDSMESKGQLNCKISSIIFKYLEGKGVPTHFVEYTPPNKMKIKKCQILPVEVVVRNVIAGSLSKRLGIAEGTPVEQPLIEFYYKNDDLHDPMVCECHVLAFKWATKAQLDRIVELTKLVNEANKEFFAKVGLKLIDFKLEFGLHKGEVILADEITPDTCRLWDINTNEKLDKDRFRRDLGGVLEAYQEVARRISVTQD